jgi:hypothetical protein
MFQNINYLKNTCQSDQVTTSKNHIPLPPCAPKFIAFKEDKE